MLSLRARGPRGEAVPRERLDSYPERTRRSRRQSLAERRRPADQLTNFNVRFEKNRAASAGAAHGTQRAASNGWPAVGVVQRIVTRAVLCLDLSRNGGGQ